MTSRRWTLAALAHASAMAVSGRVLADQGDYPYGPGMMWGGGWLHMAFGSIMMILVIAAIVVLVVLAVRWLGGHPHAGPPAGSPPPRPVDILKERLAKGEIDVAEYEERRKALGE